MPNEVHLTNIAGSLCDTDRDIDMSQGQCEYNIGRAPATSLFYLFYIQMIAKGVTSFTILSNLQIILSLCCSSAVMALCCIIL